jgi:hypothetical protein
MSTTSLRWIGLLSVVLLLWVRKPDAFHNPQFWAEDGFIFFSQQVQLGARAHLEPYAGYFNAVPRLVASVADLLPYRYAPAAYNAAALLLTLALVWKLYSPRLGLRWPPLFALAVALVPHPGGEVFVCLANVQWILALLLLTVTLQRSPETRAQTIGDAGIVLLTGLTGPFILLALPLLMVKLMVKAWRSRSRLDVLTMNLAVLAVGAAAAAVQLWTLLHAPIDEPTRLAPAPGVWGRLVGARLTGTLFLGPLAYDLPPLVLCGAGIGLLAGILWALRCSPEALERAGFCLFFAAAVVAATFVKFAESPGLLVPQAAGARYFFIPSVAVAWCLLLVVSSTRGVPRGAALIALLAILGSSLLSGFRSPPLEDFRWEEQAARIGGPEKELWIPINPHPWMIHISQ